MNKNQASISFISNNETKTRNEINIKNNYNNIEKEYHEDLLNYKLTLRKNKIQNKLMEIRLKKNGKNIKISSRQKMYEYKKLFEPNKIKEVTEKLIEKNSNYIKDKKTIELIHLYSQHINSNENIQKIFDLNYNIIIEYFFNEIIKDINSTSINFELFDYYLLILGNLFIYTQKTYENSKKEYMLLLLSILNKNSNLEIYIDENFDIINDILWLIHLYLFFNENDYLDIASLIMNNLAYFSSNKFLDVLSNFYEKKNKNQVYLSIIKEIILTLLNIYSLIYEQIIENMGVMPDAINLSKEAIQCSFDSLIRLLNYELLKNIYDENITDILALIISINTIDNYLDISYNNNFFNTFNSLFNKYKYENYDNNKINQNLIIILNKLIDNFYKNESFWQKVKDSDILPICIQNYLKNGSLINMTLITLNLFFKYPLYYNKIIIKCINYKLIDVVCDVLSNTENNEKNCYQCLNILINSYYFLENNMKNPIKENINKYFIYNNGLISKLEQLHLNDNNDIIELSSILYNKLKGL